MASVLEFPFTEVYPYQAWPKDEGTTVEFRLVYRGPLPAQKSDRGADGQGARIQDKHAIRKVFHQQLAAFWKQNPVLRRYLTVQHSSQKNDQPAEVFTFASKAIARYRDWGFNWLPLVAEEIGLACSLDILFLRRDRPGNLVKSGGDLDNRIKVLFDALRKPKERQEVEGINPGAGEDPFFCLLEDDTLISEVQITTDVLLTPLESKESLHDVVLVVRVKTLIADSDKAFVELWA